MVVQDFMSRNFVSHCWCAVAGRLENHTRSVITGYWYCVCGEVLVASEEVKLGKEGRTVIQSLVGLHDMVALRNRLAGWLARGSVNSRFFVRACVCGVKK